MAEQALLADLPGWVVDELPLPDVEEQVGEEAVVSPTPSPTATPPVLQPTTPSVQGIVSDKYPEIGQAIWDAMPVESAKDISFEDIPAEKITPEDYYENKRSEVYEYMDVSKPGEWFASDEESSFDAIKHWVGGSPFLGLRSLTNAAGITTSDGRKLLDAIQEYHTEPDEYKYSRQGLRYLQELETRFKNIVDPEDVEYKQLVQDTWDAIIDSPADVTEGIAKAIVADPLFFAAFMFPLLGPVRLHNFAAQVAKIAGSTGKAAQRIIKNSAKLSFIAAQEAIIGAAYQYGVNKSRGAPPSHDVVNMAGLSATAGVLLFGGGASVKWLAKGGKFEDQVGHINRLAKELDNEAKWIGAEVGDVTVSLKRHLDQGLDLESAVQEVRKEMDSKFESKYSRTESPETPVQRPDEEEVSAGVFTMDDEGITQLLAAKTGAVFEAPGYMPGWKIKVGPTLGKGPSDIISFDRTRKIMRVDAERAIKDFFESRRKYLHPNKRSPFGRSFDDALDRMNMNREKLAAHLDTPDKFLRFALEKERAYAQRPRTKTASLKKLNPRASTGQVRHLRNVGRHLASFDKAVKASGYKQSDLESKLGRTFNLKKEIAKAQIRSKVDDTVRAAERAEPFLEGVGRRAVRRGQETFDAEKGKFPVDEGEIRVDTEGVARVKPREADTEIDYVDTARRAIKAMGAGIKSAARDIGRVPGVGATKGKSYKRAYARNYKDILDREKKWSDQEGVPITKEREAELRQEAHRRAREEQPDVVGKVYRTKSRMLKTYKTFKGAVQGLISFVRNPRALLNEARNTSRYVLGHDEGKLFIDYAREHAGMIAVAERHIRAAVDTVLERVPSEDVRKAISHHIEGNLDAYNAWRISKGESPIEFTFDEKVAIKQVENLLSEIYKWIRKQPGGRNIKKRKNYVPHLYEHTFNTSFEDYLAQLLGAPRKAMATKSTHAYAREFDTIMDAKEAGYVPLEDIRDLLSGYLRGIMRVEANKILIDRIKNITDVEGRPLIMRRDEAPDGYKEIRHASFLDNSNQFLYAHSDIAPTLKMIFDTRNPGVLQRLLLNLTYLVKRSVLAFSMFHGVALLESALYAGMNPVVMRREFKSALEQLNSGELGDVIDLGLSNGLQVGWIDDIKGDALYNAMDAAQGILEQIPFMGKTASKIPKGVRVFHENLDKILWDKIATGGKIIAFTKNLDRLIRINAKMAEKGDVPLRDLNDLAAEAAMFTNDAFGGLNWSRMAMNVKNNMMHRVGSALAAPSGRRAMQLLIFAPDWSLANIRIQAKAFPGMNSKKDVRRLYQYYIARGAIMFAFAAEAIQQASGEGSVFDNPFPLGWMRPKLGDGMRIEWSKQLAEVPRELYYMMKGDPLHSLYWKSAFLPRAIADLSSGKSVKESVADKVVPITLSNLAKPPHWQAVAGALSKPIYVRDY